MILRTLLAAFVAVFLFPLSWGETGIGDNEILIGSCSPLGQDLGQAEIAGAKPYLEYINDQGGIFGRKIRLISLDDKFTPDGVSECYRQLMHAKVFATAFQPGAAGSILYVKLAMANKTPMIGATSPRFMYDPVKRYVINVRATFFEEGYKLAESLYESGFRKIGAIYMSDELGFEEINGAKKFFQEHHVTMTAEASFVRPTPATKPNLDAPLDTVRASNPEAVLLLGNYKPSAEILKKAKKLRWEPTFAFGTSRDAVARLAGDAAEGLLMAEMYPRTDEVRLPAIALFQKIMKQYSPEIETNDVQVLQGFVHAMLLVEGLKRAGRDLTREKLISAYEKMKNVDIGLGPEFLLNFDPGRHQGFNTVKMYIFHKGKFIPRGRP